MEFGAMNHRKIPQMMLYVRYKHIQLVQHPNQRLAIFLAFRTFHHLDLPNLVLCRVFKVIEADLDLLIPWLLVHSLNKRNLGPPTLLAPFSTMF